MKSRIDLFEKLSEKVKALHDYEVPEIIALQIIKGYTLIWNGLKAAFRCVSYI
jgi:uncharacterized protein involved in tolerance to divalent cations